MEELRNISPELLKIKKEIPFRVPDNYFDNFSFRLQLKMDELNNISPELSKIKKEVPFGVPVNYFDNFSVRLQLKLEAEKVAVPNPKNRIVQFLKPALSLAASFALIFMLVYWPLKTFIPNQVADNGNSNEQRITEMEYLSMVEGIDEYSFFALLDEPSGSEDFSDEEIVSYLQANSSEYEIYTETHY